MRSRPSLTIAFIVSAGIVLGCSGADAKAPNPTRTLDERRAVEIIRRTIAGEGIDPAPGRDVKLLDGASMFLDVGVQGKKFGVAYVTASDAAKLGTAIPPANQRDERLRLVRGGDDGTVRMVLLYQENYVYDDLAGEAHVQTTIVAERQLERDVRDFVTYAKTKRFE
jgi:hypothetical protein